MKRKWFTIKLPNGEELLYHSKTCNGWTDLTETINYFNKDYYDRISLCPISNLEAFKFLFKRRSTSNDGKRT